MKRVTAGDVLLETVLVVLGGTGAIFAMLDGARPWVGLLILCGTLWADEVLVRLRGRGTES